MAKALLLVNTWACSLPLDQACNYWWKWPPCLAREFGQRHLLCFKWCCSCALSPETKSKYHFHSQLLMPRSSLRMPPSPPAVWSSCSCSPTKGRWNKSGAAGSLWVSPIAFLLPESRCQRHGLSFLQWVISVPPCSLVLDLADLLPVLSSPLICESELKFQRHKGSRRVESLSARYKLASDLVLMG